VQTNSRLRVLLSFFLITAFIRPGWAQAPQGGLRLVIIEGDGAINNVRQRVNRDPIVQVEDENRRPIAGAAVVFFLPDQGPSGTFANGMRSLTVTTDAQGRATATGFRPNNQTGQLQIRVTASFAGQTASAIITQTNVSGGGSAGSSTGMSTGAKVLLIVGILGAAAAVGTVVAVRSNDDSGGGGGVSPPPPGITLTPGTPTVGGPR
jgi:hypothetical protein